MVQQANAGQKTGSGESAPGREAELAAQGWTRRFVALPPRLRESVELYRSLGFEVHLEAEAPEELPPQCRGCAVTLGLARAVYTRPASARGTASPTP